MNRSAQKLTLRVHSGMDVIDRDVWDYCANPDASSFNPFLSHDFLRVLEESGCATAETGWMPQHLVAENDQGRVVGTMPLYLKSHSQGEYVFDHGWANAFEQAGGDYYPKLQSSVPFTPVTGARFLVAPGEDTEAIEAALLNGAIRLVRQLGVSSLHVTFLPEASWQRNGGGVILQRTDQQFHWLNNDYGSFDDFLGVLASRKRKALKKERREAVAEGITFEHITGASITEAHWDAFFEFYQDTGSRKWGRPYLNREFFSMLGEVMADRVLLVMAKRGGRTVAGALNIIGGDTLYGRYWGAVEYHPYLHFETCYYQAIDFAIAHGLKRVEAGAQGEHKLARGYMPQTTCSLHYIDHPGLRRAVAAYLKQERKAVAHEAEILNEMGPFRKDAGDCG